MNKPIAALLASVLTLAGAAHAQNTAATPPAASAASSPSNADNAAAVKAATEAATRWLALVDADKWDETWNQLAAAGQSAVPKAGWSSGMAEMRQGIGKVQSRKLQSADFTRNVPGAPAGEYVVIRYASDFANKPGSAEMVVPMKQPDGSWKVSGYFVR